MERLVLTEAQRQFFATFGYLALPVKEGISAHVKYGIEQMYSETMLDTAGSGRMVHLEQVLANQAQG